ncbi:MAG: heat-shock protein HtpX [Betaproteobacteria bacterium HGW-Betaproteobacteria-11]|nr:MAG: heat-shock protein HtpX [Betaproteobacteria bacterium HGW-Betaproteobacteria-11]
MASYGPLLQFALLAGFVLAVTLSLLITACERPLRRILSGKTPSQRARMAWWMLVTPALAGIAYTTMTIAMPSMFDDSARFSAACSAHADTLLHLCIWHPSDSGESAWLWGALALLAGYATWLASRAAAGLWRARRTLASMVRLSWRPGHPDKLYVLDVDQPMALACGVGHGHILLSTSLMRQLDPTQLRVVLAHEQAHIANRDVLYRLIAIILSSIQLPGTRRRLLRDLELALEQRCDFAAASEVGCPVAVAETIVVVEKIFRQHAKEQMPLAMTFFSDFVAERVEVLLSPKRPSVSYLGALLGFLVLAFCSLSTGWLHSLTESFITALTR